MILRRATLRVAPLVAAVLLAACTAPSEPSSTEATELTGPPAASGALAPYVIPARDGGLWLSWLEPQREPSGEIHRLALARYREGAWSPAVTIVEGDDFFANWADTPVIAQHPNGTLLAGWLARLGEGTYAYGIQLAASHDGQQWRSLGSLHPDDVSHMEHGFMSFAPEGEGFRAFWLDGRDHSEHGMQLRTALVDPSLGAGPSEVVDDLVCDCCPTSALATGEGVLLAYRDRTPDDIRDIRVASPGEGSVPLGEEGWNIAGCPVNGPALAHSNSSTLVAWFTAADGRTRVRAAWQEGKGPRWGTPIEIAAERTLGRIGAAVEAESREGFVSWLETDGEAGQVMVRRVSPDGALSAPWKAGSADSGRVSGIPRIALSGDHLHTVWRTDDGLRFVRRSLSEF